MIIPDINLLLYAYDSSSPFHAKAAAWWRACLSGTEAVGLAQVVVFGFVRVATNARVFEHPMTPAEAAGHGCGAKRGMRNAECGRDRKKA
jgi:hypothetical protein